MRRTKPEKREIIPDVRYQSVVVSSFINRIMRCGKKSTATTMVYDALDIVARKRPARTRWKSWNRPCKNVGPVMEVRPRRVGGATYQVPMEVPSSRRMTLAMRWIIDAAKARTGKSFAEKLCGVNCWMPLITRVLLFASVKKPTRWQKPTVPSRIIVCKLFE